eukprot:6479993-Amphidinium_carterae.1
MQSCASWRRRDCRHNLEDLFASNLISAERFGSLLNDAFGAGVPERYSKVAQTHTRVRHGALMTELQAVWTQGGLVVLPGALRIELSFYSGHLERYEAVLSKEIANNQAMHGLDITAWSLDSDFFSTKFEYVRVQQRVDTVEDCTVDRMTRSGAQHAGKAATDLGLVFSGAAASSADSTAVGDDPSGGDSKALAAFAKKKAKGLRLQVQLTKLLDSSHSCLLKLKLTA